jgi:glycopeptide antibiotics resistance protein
MPVTAPTLRALQQKPRNKPEQKSINTEQTLRILCRAALGAVLLLITWLALTPSPPENAGFGWDKANHSAAFFVLSALSFYSQTKQEWIGWLSLAIYGVGIEITQWAMGFRVFEIWDMIANLIGIVSCILMRPVLIHLPVIGVVKKTPVSSPPTS